MANSSVNSDKNTKPQKEVPVSETVQTPDPVVAPASPVTPTAPVASTALAVPEVQEAVANTSVKATESEAPAGKWYSYFWLSIVALFSLLWPLGVASLFLGQRGTTNFEAGKVAEAEKDRQNSILLGVISIAGTAVILLVFLIIALCSRQAYPVYY